MTVTQNGGGVRALRLAVVNDYEVIVRGVAAMLADEPSLEVVELDCLRPVSQDVHVALYDAFAMPGMQNSDIDEMVASERVGALVLYTWDASAELVHEARRRGLRGVIAKADPVSTLVEALHRAHAGEFVVSEMFGAPPADGDPGPRTWPGREHGLTAREAEVIGLITQGFSNQEIAERMYVSINSIKSYIRSAYRTMGVTTRTQAVLWGVDNGLATHRASGPRRG
ncbi:MAG: response regulator transcription factor [Dermatophilaceae bacterium]|nr:response regulator transcription factor [Intrasporangiaceae bacterium]